MTHLAKIKPIAQPHHKGSPLTASHVTKKGFAKFHTPLCEKPNP